MYLIKSYQFANALGIGDELRPKVMVEYSYKPYTARLLDILQRKVIVHPTRIPMKKTFKLDHPKIKVPRVVDSVKHDIKKFLKKERKKNLPSGTKYWGFDCKVGQTEETAVEVHLSALMKHIDALVEKNIMTIYVELTPKAIETAKAPPAQEY